MTLLDENYPGASCMELPPEKLKALMEPFDDSAVDILPSGEVYIGSDQVTTRLLQALGTGWALVPGEIKEETGVILQKWALYVAGAWVTESWGAMDFKADDAWHDRSDALEGAKSKALTRCCKKLGIGLQCWDKRFRERWKAQFAVAVFDDKGKVRWRRTDAPPFPGERPIKQQAASAVGPARIVPPAAPRPTEQVQGSGQPPVPPASSAVPSLPQSGEGQPSSSEPRAVGSAPPLSKPFSRPGLPAAPTRAPQVPGIRTGGAK